MNQTTERQPPITDHDGAVTLCMRLQETAAQMADLLADETALLKDHRAADIAVLQDDKTRLSAAYARDYCLLKDNARYIGAVAPNHVGNLRRTIQMLRRQVETNFDTLEATRAVSQGLLTAIHDIAKRQSAGPSCYTNGAAMADHHAAQPTAIAVDRAL
jgi:hypothetical protein